MSLTKKMLEEQGFFDSDITRECPKCKGQMNEILQEEMTDGQRSDWECGFNTPFECEDCGYYALYDIGHREEIFGWEDPQIDELVEITRIDPNSFEEVIEHALSSKCFIEAISLIHNVIEAYLKRKIEDLTITDETRLQLIKEKFKPQYLHDYNTICYLLGIIDKNMYKRITKFNTERNKVIHELLKKSIIMSELKNITKEGRRIQMVLSPLNHSKQDIKNIMKHFDKITK